jgi:hypothetical protein
MHDATWPRWRPALILAFLLDSLIAIYAAVLLISAITDLDLGPLTPDHLEKTILTLLIVVPLRIALGGHSWLLDLWLRARPNLAGLRHRALERLTPAVVDVLSIVIVTRLATFTIGFVANLVFPAGRARAWQMPFEYQRFAEIFAAWDSGWYFDIARRGYYWHADHQSSVAFFPLYPMLMRLAAWPFGGTDRAVWLAGIVISCTAFVLALMALYRFTERVCGSRQVAQHTILYLAVFPFSLFFTRVYTESVFLLTTVLAISRAYDRRWVAAGLWGALATLCRPNGLLIALPLALMAFDRRNESPPRAVAMRLAALLPIPLALGAYSAYVYTLSGDPLGWLTAQASWGNSIGNPPWRLLLTMIGQLVKHGWYDYFFVAPYAPFRLFHGLTGLLFVMLVPAIFKRLGVAMGAYVLVSLLVPLSATALEGIGRYAAVLFPVFMLAGTIRSPRAHELILIVCSHFHALFICLFVTLRPIY